MRAHVQELHTVHQVFVHVQELHMRSISRVTVQFLGQLPASVGVSHVQLLHMTPLQ